MSGPSPALTALAQLRRACAKVIGHWAAESQWTDSRWTDSRWTDGKELP